MPHRQWAGRDCPYAAATPGRDSRDHMRLQALLNTVTAVHVAAENESLQCLRVLIEEGGQQALELKDEVGRSLPPPLFP